MKPSPEPGNSAKPATQGSRLGGAAGGSGTVQTVGDLVAASQQ